MSQFLNNSNQEPQQSCSGESNRLERKMIRDYAIRQSDKFVKIGNKYIRPGRLRHKRRRQCRKIISKLGDLDEAELSDKQIQTLSWAMQNLEEYNYPAKKSVADKQDAIPTSSSKDCKSLRLSDDESLSKQTTSFSEIFKDNIEMAIINRGDEYGAIPKDKWSFVEAKLAEVFFTVLEDMPGAPPICRDAGWYQDRAKLIAFGDERSVVLYKAAVNKVGDLWPGLKLDVVEKHDIPPRHRAFALIPVAPNDAESVLRMLKFSNPDLPTENWTIHRLTDVDGPQRQLTLLVNDESLPILDRTNGIISYGFSQIQLKICKDEEDVCDLTTNSDTELNDECGPNAQNTEVDENSMAELDAQAIADLAPSCDLTINSDTEFNDECELNAQNTQDDENSILDLEVQAVKDLAPSEKSILL